MKLKMRTRTDLLQMGDFSEEMEMFIKMCCKHFTQNR